MDTIWGVIGFVAIGFCMMTGMTIAGLLFETLSKLGKKKVKVDLEDLSEEAQQDITRIINKK